MGRPRSEILADLSTTRDIISRAELTAELVEATNAVPGAVSPRQLCLALLRANLLTTVEAAIATLPAEAQVEWQRASRVERNHPLVASLVAGLGMTDEQVDNIFRTAVTL